MRINKYLAKSGICSRRDADELIKKGTVTIDGRTAMIGDDVVPGMEVRVSGEIVSPPEETTVIVFYKPVGVTCTERDAHAEKTVFDVLNIEKRVTYAGRLDKDSEGLLILTDDGDLIDAMMRGANLHEKEYEVTVDKNLSESDLEKMRSGIFLEELGQKTRPCKVTKTGTNSFEIILTQGLNRQIRRMCEALGMHVLTLRRTRVMNITLGNLQVGASRNLTPEEKKSLYLECGLHI